MPKIDAVLDLIQRGDAEMLRYANALTDAERAEVGTPDHWAPKDILAHMAAWKLHIAEIIAAGRAGDAPPVELDYNDVNAGLFRKYRNSAWYEILALMNQAQHAMLAQVAGLTEANMTDLRRFPSTEGRPMWRRIVGNCFQHPLEHLSAYYIQHGYREYASHLAEEEARLVAALDDDPTLQGTVLYNLACRYALMGEKGKAYEKLALSLRLYPALKEWAPQDTDLVSLHGEKQFKLLVE
jgi:hypothetical protein